MVFLYMTESDLFILLLGTYALDTNSRPVGSKSKVRGPIFLISKWKYNFSKFQSEIKKKH